MKNVVPIIESIDKNKVLPSAEIVYRNSIMLVIKHPFENKYLYLHNKKYGWNVLVQGGVEEKENIFISAIREMIEETGYYDIKSITKLDFEMDNVYYAAHKNQNRYAIIKTFFIQLNSLKQQEHENDAEILFDTYENLYNIFGAPFRHHYYLLGIATGNQENIENENPHKLGTLNLINHKVSYRKSEEAPNFKVNS